MTSFRAQLAVIIGIKIALLSGLGVAAIWSLSAADRDYSIAMEGYTNLRSLYEIGEGILAIRRQIKTTKASVDMLDSIDVDPESDLAGFLEQLRKALMRQSAAEMRELLGKTAGLCKNFKPMPDSGDDFEVSRDQVIQKLDYLDGPIQFILVGIADDLSDLEGPVNQALVNVGDMVAAIRRNIETHEKSVQDFHHMVRRIFIGLMAAVVIGLVMAGGKVYRAFMRPLVSLGAGVRELAKGNLDQRIEETGPLEFAILAMNFNAMADQIRTLCENLESDVASKSRELSQSERLASVGRLAAGVAHEINNPMGIIAGNAELALKEMDQLTPQQAIDEAKNALSVIAQEAFRCKEIVNRLLSMSRGDEGVRAPVSLTKIAIDVAGTVRSLMREKPCAVLFTAPDDLMEIMGIEGEIRQVALNLVVNAAEASRDAADAGGEVRIELSRGGGWIELIVADNGKGMTPEVIERVFEPFFTDKRGSGNPGTGLGLSISHAIVKRHGGEIAAYSAGPGAGSRFVVKWPELRRS